MDAEIKGRLKSLLSKKFLLWLVVTGVTIAGKLDWSLWAKLTMAYFGANALGKVATGTGLLGRLFKKDKK